MLFRAMEEKLAVLDLLFKMTHRLLCLLQLFIFISYSGDEKVVGLLSLIENSIGIVQLRRQKTSRRDRRAIDGQYIMLCVDTLLSLSIQFQTQ